MRDRSSRQACEIACLLLCALVALTAGCKTPDGPHLAIPEQDLSMPVPAGLTRVVFLNTNFVSEAYGAGPIRIQLGGRQLPSVWPERYVQAFVEPGEYELLIEQSYGFFWKSRDQITVAGDQILVSLYRTTIGLFPHYEIVEELPSDFEEAFRPGRHPASW